MHWLLRTLSLLTLLTIREPAGQVLTYLYSDVVITDEQSVLR